MVYEPPKDIYEVDANLMFNEPLSEDDPRYVDTSESRGDFSYEKLYKYMGLRPKDMSLTPKSKEYILFTGHRGCGKSTELRKLARRIDGPEKFFVVSADATLLLDTNNLQYPDVLMALARELLHRLDQSSIVIDNVFLSNLQTWFKEKVETAEATRDFAASVKAGANLGTGIPFLGKLFFDMTQSFQTNSTYKEGLRQVIKNSYSQFVASFNQLIVAAEAAVVKANLGKKILFIVDGTDRLSQEDSDRLFIHDSNQLLQVSGNFLYCAQINILDRSVQAHTMFDVFILPMIKISEKNSTDKITIAYAVLREMIYKRADRSLFDSDDTVDKIIAYSGGCPRELLKLLHYTHANSDSDTFDSVATDKAIKQLSKDYERFLKTEDYSILNRIDVSDQSDDDDRERFLLYNLALLEYNSYWRASHPVVRLLDGYKRAKEAVVKA